RERGPAPRATLKTHEGASRCCVHFGARSVRRPVSGRPHGGTAGLLRNHSRLPLAQPRRQRRRDLVRSGSIAMRFLWRGGSRGPSREGQAAQPGRTEESGRPSCALGRVTWLFVSASETFGWWLHRSPANGTRREDETQRFGRGPQGPTIRLTGTFSVP